MTAAASASASRWAVASLIVSKDRAFQLKACLHSLFRFGSTSGDVQSDVTVIYAVSSALHDSAYAIVRAAFPKVRFLRESTAPAPTANDTKLAATTTTATSSATASAAPASGDGDFYSLLHHFITSIAASADFIMFGVDDMLFYRPFEWHPILMALRNHQTSTRNKLSPPPKADAAATATAAAAPTAAPTAATAAWSLSGSMAHVFSYHFVLHAQLSYCHTANKTIRKPPFLPLTVACASTSASSASSSASASVGLSYAFFERSAGSHDFNYPFSLCGGVYASDHVRTLWAALAHSHHTPGPNTPPLTKPASPAAYVDGRWSGSHPNRFELYANRMLAADLNVPKRAAPASGSSAAAMAGFWNLLANSAAATQSAAPSDDATASAAVSAALAKYIGTSGGAAISAAAAASAPAAAATAAAAVKSDAKTAPAAAATAGTGAGNSVPCCKEYESLVAAATALLPAFNHSACAVEPLCSVVTVNRVQQIFKNPIYTTPTLAGTATTTATAAAGATAATGTSACSGEVDELARRLIASPDSGFDIDSYARACGTFNSVHISHFQLTP